MWIPGLFGCLGQTSSYGRKSGQLIKQDESNFVWLSNLDCCTAGLPPPLAAMPVQIPLGRSGIMQFLDVISTIVRHDFHPAFLTFGAGIMVLHYSQLIWKRGHCHMRTATCQSSMVHKKWEKLLHHSSPYLSSFVTVLHSTLVGQKKHISCCGSAFPVGCDDPPSQVLTGKLIVELLNGAKCILMKHGDQMPIASCIISANINLSETAKLV